MRKMEPERSLWIHLAMVAVVGVTLIFVGAFISWKSHVVSAMVTTMQHRLDNQDRDIAQILENQSKIMQAIK